MKQDPLDLINSLAQKASLLRGDSNSDLERFCWMVVHEYIHGVMPVEYDIREIDESLYLSVLKKAIEGNFNS